MHVSPKGLFMRLKKPENKCRYCKSPFVPRPQLGLRQKACSDFACLKLRRQESKILWNKKNKTLHLQMIRDWFHAHPDYLKNYRLFHPDYRIKNSQATLKRKQMTKSKFDKRTRDLPSNHSIKGK